MLDLLDVPGFYVTSLHEQAGCGFVPLWVVLRVSLECRGLGVDDQLAREVQVCLLPVAGCVGSEATARRLVDPGEVVPGLQVDPDDERRALVP